jgi:hypothetical protein
LPNFTAVQPAAFSILSNAHANFGSPAAIAGLARRLLNDLALRATAGPITGRPPVSRSTFSRSALLALGLSTALATGALAQEKVLRIGMTAADIPRTHGQTASPASRCMTR